MGFLSINNNVSSLVAQRNLGRNTFLLNKSFERLSSGFRINRAADDAAGLSISEGLRAQIRGLEQASNNAQTGINLLNVAEGSLSSVQEDLQRMRELAVQGANDTLSADDRTAIQAEMDQLVANINQVTGGTTFNGIDLLGTGAPASLDIQVGAGTAAGANVIDIASALGTTTFTGLTGGTGSVSVSTASASNALIGTLDTALSNLSTQRTRVGAFSNRLQSASDNIAIRIENFTAAESRIRDVDIAKETSNLVKLQILQQAGAGVLAQANQSAALSLLLIGGT